MLLFNKKDMQIICKYDGETVTFSKPLKDILKYQYKYNYRFKLYTTEGYIIADDFKIEGDVLTVLFGTVTVTYSASGAEYNDTTGGGGSGGGAGEVTVYHFDYIPNEELPDGYSAGMYILEDASTVLNDTGFYYLAPPGEYERFMFFYKLSIFESYLNTTGTTKQIYVPTTPPTLYDYVEVLSWEIADIEDFSYNGKLVCLSRGGQG